MPNKALHTDAPDRRAGELARYREKGEKDEQTPRRPKRHDRGEDVMGFIYRPLSSTAQGASNVSNG
jgi:hypothetical protein